MRSCLHSVSLPNVPVLEVMHLAKASGYRSIELNAENLPWAKPHVTPSTTPAERAAIGQLSQELDLPIVALGAHISMVDAHPDSRRDALAFVLGCIDFACDVHAPIVHILSGPLPQGTTKGEAWPWFSHAVQVATQHAEEKGIILAIEAIAGHMFCLIDDYHRLIAELPAIQIRVNFDPSHLIVQGEDPLRVVTELGDRIVHVHAKDGAGHFPNFTFPPVGQGEVKFPALRDGLVRVGFSGAVSIEYEAQVFGFKLDDEAILRTGREFLTYLGVA